ncbi:hypothetical protein PGB90_005084 [Kerria lacca]
MPLYWTSFVTGVSIAFPLPELTASGCRVTFHKVLNDENCLFDVRCIVKYLLMLGDIRLLEEGPISGDIVIFDAVHAKASMVSKLINPIVKKGIMCSQNAFPQRLKEVHVINVSSYLDSGINIIKMFVKPKIKDRVRNYKKNEWYKKLESYRSYFEDQENVCSNEPKRINKAEPTPTEYEELFGTKGSFSKLSID